MARAKGQFAASALIRSLEEAALAFKRRSEAGESTTVSKAQAANLAYLCEEAALRIRTIRDACQGMSE